MSVRGAKQPSLVQRLVATAAVWCVVVLFVVGLAQNLMFRQAALHNFESYPREVAYDLLSEANISSDSAVTVTGPANSSFGRTFSGYYWQIADLHADGSLHALARSPSLGDMKLELRPETIAALRGVRGTVVYFDTAGPDGQSLHGAAIGATLRGLANPVIFIAAEDTASIDDEAKKFSKTTFWTLLMLGAGLVGVVFLQVRLGLKPLFDLGAALGDVRAGKLQRLSSNYPQEIAPLAVELNALLDHNAEVVERQRTHVGNLAHALKTPISVMMAESERDPTRLAAIVQRQTELMKGQVDHHLRRARAAARFSALGERTELEPVVDELAVALERVFRDKGVVIDWRLDDAPAFLGEKQDLQEILGNLMENACKWCAGKLFISAEAAGDGAFDLIVEDDGPGLAEAEYDAALKRGQRLDETAPGTGLGLSIVADLAKAYGGDVRLGRSERLGGLSARVRLPKAG